MNKQPMDRYKTPLCVGDRVVTACPYYHGLYDGTITRLLPKTADITLDWREEKIRQCYCDIVKIAEKEV